MRAVTARAVLESPVLRPVLLLVALVVVWQAAVSLFAVPKWLIPAPLEVITEIGKEWPRLWREGPVTAYVRRPSSTWSGPCAGISTPKPSSIFRRAL